LIKLGWLASPNNIYKPQNLVLFVDSLLTYGSNYGDLADKQKIYEPYNHRCNRLSGIRDLTQIHHVLKQGKDEIKGLPCQNNEDCVKQLILACLHSLSHFFDGLKKLMKKYESKYNFGPEQIGHLIPLTVGHRDRPKEREKKYIETIMAMSGIIPRRD
jgi:hypothetical protein